MNRRERQDRRRSAIAERKAETKARLREPAAPPRESVARPWKRRTARRGERRLRGELSADSVLLGGPGAVITPVVSHDAMDVAGSMVAIAAFVSRLGRRSRA